MTSLRKSIISTIVRYKILIKFLSQQEEISYHLQFRKILTIFLAQINFGNSWIYCTIKMI